MRDEHVVFSELEALCRSPGYIYAIGLLFANDALIIYTNPLSQEDIENSQSDNALTRTELSTLIGLMVKGKVNYTCPRCEALKTYVEKTSDLLNELHSVIREQSFPLDNFKKLSDSTFDPFSQDGCFREAVFYGPESTYRFQHREMMLKKYRHDNGWLKNQRGFSITDAQKVFYAIQNIQNKKLNVDKPRRDRKSVV